VIETSPQFAHLFHGSSHELVGDTLEPDKRSGASAGSDYHKHRGQSIKDVVSASSDESKAWEMAGKSGGGRTRVWEVEPHSETRMGVEHVDHPQFAARSQQFNGVIDNKEFVAPSYRVKQQLDIKPGQQGTFPQVDWNKHGAVFLGDANHPPHPSQNAQHTRALIEHRSRTHPDEDVSGPRAARLASKPETPIPDPNQISLF